MINKFTAILITGICSSCNLLDNGANFPDDNQSKSETIYFSGRLSTGSADWYLSPSDQRATFDKSRYTEIDSIIFQAGLRTPTGDVDCEAQLYIINEEKEVSGSNLRSVVSYQLNQVRSEDLQYSIPDQEVELGVRLRSSRQGVTVYSGDASFLMVYYK